MARTRAGFSLVECLTVLAVIGLLAAILLPAVQSARETARRVQCSNNLKQLALGLANYQTAHGTYPGGVNGLGYSFHSALLSWLDQSAVFNSVNFQRSAAASPENETIRDSSLNLFLCPSDRAVPASTSYAGNWSPGFRATTSEGAFSGPFERPFTPASFTDGLSVTVSVSEWILGAGKGNVRDVRSTVFSAVGSPADVASVASACLSSDKSILAISSNTKGPPWLEGGYATSMYNHALGINGPSCTNNGSLLDGVFTAGSPHPGGAHCAYADGHISFVRETISTYVWQSLGSRRGGEILPAF